MCSCPCQNLGIVQPLNKGMFTVLWHSLTQRNFSAGVPVHRESLEGWRRGRGERSSVGQVCQGYCGMRKTNALVVVLLLLLARCRASSSCNRLFTCTRSAYHSQLWYKRDNVAVIAQPSSRDGHHVTPIRSSNDVTVFVRNRLPSCNRSSCDRRHMYSSAHMLPSSYVTVFLFCNAMATIRNRLHVTIGPQVTAIL